MSIERAYTPPSWPLGGIALDLAVAASLYLLRDASGWILEHMLPVYWSVGLLQALALSCVFEERARAERGPAGARQHVEGLMTILAVGGFMWLFLPALVMDTGAAWTACVFNLFAGLFGGLIAVALTMDRKRDARPGAFLRVLGFLAPIAYLTVSQNLIRAAALSGSVEMGFALIAILVSYLPIRFLMIANPPRGIVEILTATGAFAYFLYTLFA